MSPDCVLKRGRSAGKGSATPYMANLQGARLAICDEAGDEAELDDEAVKRATGGTTIEARYLHSNPVYFKPTHLPILLTNHRPRINVDDDAVLRRLLIILFDFLCKDEEHINRDDPQHRPMDKLLAEKLLTSQARKQLLSWLVRGAVAWQQDGLPSVPARAKAAFQDYKNENDVLQKHLDERCETGEGFEVQTQRFADCFNKGKGHDKVWSQKKIVMSMNKKGFMVRRSSAFDTRAMAFQGVRLLPESSNVAFDDE